MDLKSDAERLMVLVHTYEAMASGAAHIFDPSLNVEAFRIQAEALSREYPALRAAVARIHLSLAQLQAASPILATMTDWTDQQLYSDANPCQPIWESLQKEIAEFDRLFVTELQRRLERPLKRKKWWQF